MLKALAFAAAFSLASAHASAAVIVPASATASSTFNNGFYSPGNLISGSGVSAPGLHDASFTTMWMTNLGVNQAQVTFDLGGVFALDGAAIWNYNFGNPAEFQSTILRGVKDFRILSSLDGITYEEIFAGTLAMGTGQPLPSQNFGLTGTAAFIQFDILNNYGQGTYAERDWSSGLSEVQFLGTAVPEPATWVMMLLGFGAVGIAIRRRREGLPQLA